MSDISNITITGNLAADPEQLTSGSGRSRVVLRVANGRYRRAKDPGQKGSVQPTWYRVTVFRDSDQAFLLNYAKKGTFVCVAGSYDQVPMDNGKGVFNDITNATVKVGPRTGAQATQETYSTSIQQAGTIDNDDDIPF